MNTNVREVLNTIVEKFKSGEVPEAVALASFPIPDIPSAKWSFTNRLIMFFAGTGDARGFLQWRDVDRWVTKGAKAFHILVPCFKKDIDEETGEEKPVLRFFKSAPVFRYEDTEGRPLEYLEIEIPDLPLIERAEEWGISVKAVPGSYRYLGYYAFKKKEIVLASPEETTFFHELAHAGHEKVNGSLTNGQDPLQEIVAELSARALCHLVGKRARDTSGNSYRYIESYAEKMNLTTYAACLRVLSDTEKVLNLILGKTQEVQALAA